MGFFLGHSRSPFEDEGPCWIWGGRLLVWHEIQILTAQYSQQMLSPIDYY